MFSQSPFKNRQIVPKVSCVVYAYIYIYISFYMGKEKRARLPYLLARGDLPYGTALSAITYRSRGGGGKVGVLISGHERDTCAHIPLTSGHCHLRKRRTQDTVYGCTERGARDGVW